MRWSEGTRPQTPRVGNQAPANLLTGHFHEQSVAGRARYGHDVHQLVNVCPSPMQVKVTSRSIFGTVGEGKLAPNSTGNTILTVSGACTKKRYYVKSCPCKVAQLVNPGTSWCKQGPSGCHRFKLVAAVEFAHWFEQSHTLFAHVCKQRNYLY